MAATLPQSYKYLPANNTEMSALKKLLDGDLEHRSSILRRQEEVQEQYTYAKKADEIFVDCLATTRAVHLLRRPPLSMVSPLTAASGTFSESPLQSLSIPLHLRNR